MVGLGYSKLYKSKNPFEFMETIGFAGRTNFFESRNTVYQLAGVLSDKKNNRDIVISEDF